MSVLPGVGASERGSTGPTPTTHDLAKHMPSGVASCKMIFDGDLPVDWVYLEVNAAFGALTGLSEVAGKRASEVLPGIATQDPALLAHYGRVARTGVPERFEIFVRTLETWFSMSTYRPCPEHFVTVFDVVTAKKKADEALRTSEERLAAMLASLDDLVVGFDLEGRFVDFHAPEGMLLCASPSEFLGKHYADVMPGPIASAFGAAMVRVLETGRADSFDYATDVDGERRWASAKMTGRRDANGSLASFTVVCRDITARKRSEDALRASEQQLRMLLDLAPVGIAKIDVETTRFLRANARLCAIVGYSEAELLTMTVTELAHPDDAVSVANVRTAMQREPGRETKFERRYVRKDGTVAWVKVTAASMHDADGSLQCLITVEDVSDLRAAESASRLKMSALQAAANGIVITDAQGSVEWVNEAFTRLTGYDAASIVGDNLRVLHSDQQSPEFYREMWTSIGSGKVWRGELVNRRRDGSTYPEEMTITPVLDEQGAITHYIGIKQDISERRRAASQLLETAEQLRVAQKMEAVGRLAGGVAHDFNNMLRVILSYAELATSDLHDQDPLRADLDEIMHAGRRAETLTKQLLAFSRRQVLEPEPLDLNELVTGLSRMLGRLIGEDIELVVAAEEAVFETTADRGQLEQVLMNLAVNARDAMPKGGKLSIETRNAWLTAAEAKRLEVEPGRYVELTVTDTGVGMDAAVRERIFEPFFTTKPVGKGTGLGLAMAYGIVRQSGGAITVESTPGEGTTFRILLKRGTDTARPISHRRRTGATSGDESILVVEDEAALRSVLRRVLTASGYQVHLAANAGEALLLCEDPTTRVDLVLTDVIMPGMSGRQLAERVVKSRPEAKVLFMSGYTDEAIERHGVVDSRLLLRKPFDRQTLTETVRAVLDD